MQVSAIPVEHRLGCLNWPDLFPYAPDVKFTISHDGSSILLRFDVHEKAVRAVCAADRENIWEDSCVEFFFEPVAGGPYYNIECSCVGKILMCCGEGRENRKPVSDEALKGIERRCSLGSEPLGLIEKPCSWWVELKIPVSSFCFHDLKSFEGLEGRGNFYKCGSLLPDKYFLTWAPVKTEKPDFHRPEYFDVISFV